MDERKRLLLSVATAVPVLFALDVVICWAVWPTLNGFDWRYWLRPPHWCRFQHVVGLCGFMGVILGQLTLIAVTIALKSGPVVMRFSAGLALFGLLVLSWFTGAVLNENVGMPCLEDSLWMIMFGATLVAVIALGLGVLNRRTLRYIAFPSAPHEAQTREPITLKAIFAAMAVVASFVAVAKTLVSGAGDSTTVIQRGFTGALGVILLGSVLGLIIASLAWPSVWIILGDRHRMKRWWCALAGALALLPVIFIEAYALFIALFTTGVWRQPNAMILVYFVGPTILVGLVLLLVVASGLGAVRAFGFRFRPGVEC